MTTTSLPIPVMVKRYQCPHCALRRANRTAAVEHIGRCWKNPDNRTCLTCANYESVPDGEPCFPGRYCNCNEGYQRCRADVDLPVGPEFPVTDCALWRPIEAVVAP